MEAALMHTSRDSSKDEQKALNPIFSFFFYINRPCSNWSHRSAAAVLVGRRSSSAYEVRAVHEISHDPFHIWQLFPFASPFFSFPHHFLSRLQFPLFFS
jgi:hypothetical protein